MGRTKRREKLNRFYTYLYLDPRKTGVYKYLDFTFDYEPLYVGKGEGNRLYAHLTEALSDTESTSYKINKIRKILSDELVPIIVKIKKDLFEEEAFLLEKQLIEEIGFFKGAKFNLKVGPLTNVYPGGKGNIERKTDSDYVFHTTVSSENGTHPWFGVNNSAKYKEKRDRLGLLHHMQEKALTGETWWTGDTNPIHKRVEDGLCTGNNHHNRNNSKQKNLDKELLLKEPARKAAKVDPQIVLRCE